MMQTHLSRRSLGALLASTALAACAKSPLPNPKIPATWVDPVASAEPAIWPSAEWWSGFGLPELNELMTTAVADNRNLAAAAARILQAEASAGVAGANRYPIVSGTMTTNRSSRSVPGSQDDGNTSIVSRSSRATLQASYQLDLFGQIRNSSNAAQTRIESSAFDRETVRITLCSDVATTYFQVLTFRERIQSANERLDIARRLLTLVETQRRYGSVSDLEVSQQRSAVASQEAALAALRLGERQSLDALAALCGKLPGELSIVTQSLDNAVLPDIRPGLPSELLVRRPDLRKAESDLRANRFDVATARAARFPNIALTAQAGSATQELSNLFSAGTFFRNLAANLTAPIFSGNRLEAQEDLQRARGAELIATYEQSVLNAFRDTEDALAAVRENALQEELTQTAYEQAAIAYRIAETRYRAGTQPFQDVLEAQRALLQADESMSQSRQARFAAVVGLALALGGGWSEEG